MEPVTLNKYFCICILYALLAWGTNRLPFLRDKWVAVIEGQTGCPSVLRNKQVALLGGQTGSLIGYGDKLIALFEGQMGCCY